MALNPHHLRLYLPFKYPNNPNPIALAPTLRSQAGADHGADGDARTEQHEPGPDRDLVVLPEAMLAELEAFLHVRGLEHAALPDFIRWLLVRLGPDTTSMTTSRAGGKRLAPTTRHRTELLFNREIDRRLEADLASVRACRYASRTLCSHPACPMSTPRGPLGASQGVSE